MFFRRFFGFVFVVVLLLGMCGLISSTAYRSGWSEGFVSGQTADGGTAENIPGSPFNRGSGDGFGIFPFFGWALAAFLKFWFFLFLMGLLFKLLFRGGRGWHRGRPSGKWDGGKWGGWQGRRHHHGSGHEKGGDFKGQRPPWYDDSGGEPVMKA